MKPPYGEAAGGGAGRVAVSREFGILKYQIPSRYTMNENSLSKELCERWKRHSPLRMMDPMPEFHFYEPSKGHGLPHDPFKAIVAPRPIGWISTRDAEGRVNLAPYSFFNAVCDHPPMVMFSSSGWKDTVSSIKATGEFVCNLVTRPLAEKMNQTSAALAHGVSEFEFAKLGAAPSRMVAPPRVAEAPAALECKLVQIVQLHGSDGFALDQYLTIGEVVGVHINRAYLKEGLFDLLATHPVQRAGYTADYTEATTAFQMKRPQ